MDPKPSILGQVSCRAGEEGSSETFELVVALGAHHVVHPFGLQSRGEVLGREAVIHSQPQLSSESLQPAEHRENEVQCVRSCVYYLRGDGLRGSVTFLFSWTRS